METNLDPQISKFFKRSSTKSFTDVKTTPVILVCIYNKNSEIITHNLLHTVFSTYGKILRVTDQDSFSLTYLLDSDIRKTEGLESFCRI